MINNAGILRDRMSFTMSASDSSPVLSEVMDEAERDAVVDVPSPT